MTHVRHFRVDQPLVTGITLLEASAGTGKTYQIANLVLRLVAEGVADIRELVVVTFTKAATAELKDRIRKRLIAGYQSLSSTVDVSTDDELFTHYQTLSHSERALYQGRLHRALERFDEASISTIHGFCQRLLQNNAFESGADFGLNLVKDTSILLEQLVDDFLVNQLHDTTVSTYGFLVNEAGYTRAELLRIAKHATSNLDMEILPKSHDLDRLESTLAETIHAFQSEWRTLDTAQLDAFKQTHAILKSGQPSKKLSYVHFKGQIFNEKKTLIQLSALQSWVADGCPPPDSKAEFFSHFSPERLHKAAQSDRAHDVASSLCFKHLAEVGRLAQTCHTTRIENARVHFGQWIRCAYEAAHRAHGTQGYDELVRQLAHQLNDHERRPDLVRALRQRFKVALIDEFQDTDGAQWDVFRKIFTPGGSDGIQDGYLYLIGDPKQAIYGFRGANIHVYLKAKHAAGLDRVFTLTTNYRSDVTYVSAMNALMDKPGFFGDVAIPYIPVAAAHDRGGLRNVDGSSRAALSLRLFDSQCLGQTDGTSSSPVSNREALEVLPELVAADIVEALKTATIPDGRLGRRKVHCKDIAILVYSAQQARTMRTTMDAWGLPAVLAKAGSVFESEEADMLLRWLESLEHPRRESTARVCAVTRLFGWTGDDLRLLHSGDSEIQDRWDRWMEHLRQWSDRARQRGFMSAFRNVLEYARNDETVQEYLLRSPGGERSVTNLRHLAEILHTVESTHKHGIGGLARWLKHQQRDTDEEYSEAAQLRLESDAEAIRIVTMHASKGLQYPLVFLPYLWRGKRLTKDTKTCLTVESLDDPSQRVLALHADLRATSPKAPFIARAERSTQEEALRLFYVAMTRAQYATTVYWGGSVQCSHNTTHRPEFSPLAAVLHGHPTGEGGSNDRIELGQTRVTDAEHASLMADAYALSNGSDTHINVTVCRPPIMRHCPMETTEAQKLETQKFRRAGLDQSWGRWSYSSITDGQHGHRQESFDGQDRDGSDDDGQSPNPGVSEPTDNGRPLPLGFFPSGPDAGTCLHEMLEIIDFQHASAVEGSEEYTQTLTLIRDTLTRHGFGDQGFEIETFHGLRAALQTPLGGPLGQYSLCELRRADRIDEMDFDFPLTHKESTGHPHTIQKHHWISVFDSFGHDTLSARYLDSLRQVDFQPIKGFMTGFIDLVFRVPHEGRLRYFIADYKSNRIAPWGVSPNATHFSTESMQSEMERQHYFIQSHLYTVALHRFLKWRMPDYRYERDIGGAFYFFLRGMTGQTRLKPNQTGPGCHFHKPSLALVNALDQCLGGPRW